MSGLWLIPLAWLAVVLAVLFWYRHELLAVWREPVLRHPVLIIESDDWGAGLVQAQAQALDAIVDVLTRHRDCTGRHPVMTLALVLAVPDGPAIRRDGRYHRINLEDPLFAPVRQAIERGRAAGVFALQLHGLEHYWPEALMASQDPTVRAWLEADPPATTERLPSPLQSRWVDASVLPSRPLPEERVRQAATEEVRLFERIFGERPRVAVPPTFVWTGTVERAWADAGVQYVVTPGLRSACRDARGMPACDRGPIRNGDRNGPLTYLARYDYFEPLRGRDAAHALEALARAVGEARPCLLENHRDNFIAGADRCAHSLEALDVLCAQALLRQPGLRFLSTEELARRLREQDPDWVELRTIRRLRFVLARLRATGRLWRLARLTGLAWLASSCVRLSSTRPVAAD